MTVYTRVGADALVNTKTLHEQHQSVSAQLADGVMVVWADTGTSGGGSAGHSTIRGQRYSSTGEKSGDEIVISTGVTSDMREPAITVLAYGEYVVT